jgi:hypothetical protein
VVITVNAAAGSRRQVLRQLDDEAVLRLPADGTGEFEILVESVLFNFRTKRWHGWRDVRPLEFTPWESVQRLGEPPEGA